MRYRLFQILHSFEGKSVLIVGDVMLDRYYIGDVDRISPEAPVPIVHIKEEKFVPGGAANTANNCATLNGNPLLTSVVGNDNARTKLISSLEKKSINVNGLVIADDRPTIQKIRVMGGKQQLARIDYEDTSQIGDATQKQILDYIERNIIKVDAVIFSDYAKGLVSKEFIRKIIKLAKQNKKPTIADVKPKHINFFKGVTIITPNKKEAAEMSDVRIKDEKDIIQAGKKLVKEIDTNVLVTLGPDGMILFKKEGSIQKFPVKAQEVFDVSGAGDTVVAALTLAIAAGARLEEAAIISNYAAGIVVGKLGTATTTIDEIKDSMRQEL